MGGWLLCGLLGPAFGAARETDDLWIRGIFTGNSPRPVPVAESDAWERAGALARQTPGAVVLVGFGESMLPLYPPGTILVLQPLAFENLARGQTAIYRNRAHQVVAHTLVAKARDGWRSAGINNRIHDMDAVQAANLLGVVIAAFLPMPDVGPGLVVASVR